MTYHALTQTDLAVEKNNNINIVDSRREKMEELCTKMTETLQKSGIPAIKIHVFGYNRSYVHITCKGESTAKKWMVLLNTIFETKDTKITKTLIECKHNKGTCLNKSMMNGFLISLAI